jgi:hypothetical protein
MMDLQNYSEIIRKTMEEVAFGNPDSVASKAEAQLKEFLETNTSIPDDQKAQVYANFLQQIVTTTINQAINAALQLPINQKQIEVMEREVSVKEALKDSDIAVNQQKIASMQAEDEARKNEVAAKVARAKIEVERVIPSQIALNEKQAEAERERIEILKTENDIKKEELKETAKKLKIMDAQVEVEKKRVEVMAKEAEIAREKIPLIRAQAEVEEKKVGLMEAQTKIEQKRIPLVEKQIEAEQANIELTKARTDIEKEKLEFERDKAWYDSVYKRAQAETMKASITANKEIERCKCDTQLKIAQIRAETL